MKQVAFAESPVPKREEWVAQDSLLGLLTTGLVEQAACSLKLAVVVPHSRLVAETASFPSLSSSFASAVAVEPTAFAFAVAFAAAPDQSQVVGLVDGIVAADGVVVDDC